MEVPKSIGKYEILGKLGKGGMAEVFLARKTGAAGFEKKLALKRLPTDQLDDKILVKSLINEAMLAAQLSHANLVQVFEFELIDDDYCLVMEYVDGVTLDAVLQRCRVLDLPIPQGLVVFLALEVGAGLDYAHTACSEAGEPLGLVHRDVKPSNIMITRRGQVKIMDFGIARAATNPYKTTQSGGVKGTLAYMSPEQLSGDDNLGPQSDLFSLGVVLYEMATLQRLLDDSNLLMLAKNLLEGLRPDAREGLNACFPDLVPVVSRLLETDPARRYPDARSLLLDLRALNTGANAIDMADFVADLGASVGADASAGTIPSSGRHKRPSTGDALLSDTRRRVGSSAPVAAMAKPSAGRAVFPPTVTSSVSEAGPMGTETSPSGVSGTFASGPTHRVEGAASARTSGTFAPDPRYEGAGEPASAIHDTIAPVSPPKNHRMKVLLALTFVVALLAGWGVFQYLSGGRNEQGPVAEAEGHAGEPGSPLDSQHPGETTVPEPSQGKNGSPIIETAARPADEGAGPMNGENAAEKQPTPVSEGAAGSGRGKAASRTVTPKKRRVHATRPAGQSEKKGGKQNVSGGSAGGAESPKPAPASDPGYLVVNSMPWSIVYLNGEKRGQVPLHEHVAPGTYEVRLECEDGRKKQFKVEVGPGAQVTKVWLFDDNNWME